MPISSIIVRTGKATQDAVVEAIANLPGATVSDVEPTGLIVLTETAESSEDKYLWDVISQMDGVLSMDLIYHNFEELGREES
jgi:nitrate reductase NapAB chaperone NapD